MGEADLPDTFSASLEIEEKTLLRGEMGDEINEKTLRGGDDKDGTLYEGKGHGVNFGEVEKATMESTPVAGVCNPHVSD